MQSSFSSEFSKFPVEVQYNNTKYELCLAENIVMIFDIATHECQVINKDLLPISLYRVTEETMFSAVMDWLIRRALPISRKNYNAILKSVGLASNYDTFTIIEKYCALSLVDNYWIRKRNSNLLYADVNLYQHHFADLLAVSLFGGKPLTITGASPDINQRGCMAKCYSREADSIYIYKYSKYSEKIYAEVFASKIADICGFNAIKYISEYKYGKLCSKCRLGTSEQISWITASEVGLAGIDVKDLALKLSPEQYYQMLLFDYLTGNIDRHNENWSFLMNNEGRVLELAPLYDFDNCFLADETTVSKITLRPLLYDARKAITYLQAFNNTYKNRLLSYLTEGIFSSNETRLVAYTMDKLQQL